MTQGHGRLASQCSSSSSTRSGRTIGRRVWMRRRRMCLRLRNRLLSCASLSVLNDSGSPPASLPSWFLVSASHVSRPFSSALRRFFKDFFCSFCSLCLLFSFNIIFFFFFFFF